MSKIRSLVLSIIFICFNVEAGSTILTHDRFVYLTDSEQEQFIIKTMEFVVDLESNYQYEVTTYGYNEERYKRYTSTLKKVMSFLIETAHAEATPTLEEVTQRHLAQAKAKLSTTTPTPLVLKQGERVKNPVPQNIARAKKSWEEMADDFYAQINRPASGPIAGKCIYAGWVSEMRGNPSLCVHPNFINPKSPSNSPENMTYGVEQGCNGKNQITCNPVIFGYKSENDKSLFCVPAGIPESHNSALSCMKAALSDKSDTKTDTKEVRLKNLRQRLVAKPDAFANVQKFIYQYCICNTAPGSTDKSYHDRIRPHRTCFGMIEMVAETSICEEPKIDIDTTIFKSLRNAATSGKISKSSGGSAIDAFYKNFLGDVKKSNPTEYKALCPNDGTPEIIAKPKEETKPVETTPTTKKYSCIQAQCMVKTSTIKVDGEVKSSTPATEDGKSAPADGTGSPFEATCMYKFSEEGKSETVDPDALIEAAPKSREDKEIKVSASFEGKTQDLTCPIAFEDVATPPDESKKPGIKLELKDKTDTTQNLLATATDREGLKIVWIRKGYKVTQKEEPKKEESKIKVAGEEEEPKKEEKKPEEKTPEDGGTESLSENDDKTTVTVPRITTDYTVCAQLVGEDKKSVGEDCKTVPKADKKAAPPLAAPINRGMASPGQQPQMPSRMGNDTSAMGIR